MDKSKARNTLILQTASLERVTCEYCKGAKCANCLGTGVIYRAAALVLLMALCSAHCYAFPWHRSHVDREFVSDTVAELKDAALTVGLYQKYPPMMTEPKADALYIQRAEADIAVAQLTLHRYEHRQAAKQDVETVMSQLSRDLEDVPPDSPRIDPRPRA